MKACPKHTHTKTCIHTFKSSDKSMHSHAHAHRPPLANQTFTCCRVESQLRRAEMLTGKSKCSLGGPVAARRWQETQQQVYTATADTTRDGPHTKEGVYSTNWEKKTPLWIISTFLKTSERPHPSVTKKKKLKPPQINAYTVARSRKE